MVLRLMSNASRAIGSGPQAEAMRRADPMFKVLLRNTRQTHLRKCFESTKIAIRVDSRRESVGGTLSVHQVESLF